MGKNLCYQNIDRFVYWQISISTEKEALEKQFEGEKAVGERTGMKTRNPVLKVGGGMRLEATSREFWKPHKIWWCCGLHTYVGKFYKSFLPSLYQTSFQYFDLSLLALDTKSLEVLFSFLISYPPLELFNFTQI